MTLCHILPERRGWVNTNMDFSPQKRQTKINTLTRTHTILKDINGIVLIIKNIFTQSHYFRDLLQTFVGIVYFIILRCQFLCFFQCIFLSYFRWVLLFSNRNLHQNATEWNFDCLLVSKKKLNNFRLFSCIISQTPKYITEIYFFTYKIALSVSLSVCVSWLCMK